MKNKTFQFTLATFLAGLSFLGVAQIAHADEMASAQALSIEGKAFYQRQGTADWAVLDETVVLSQGDAVKTEANSKVKLALKGVDKTAEIDVRPSSQFVFETFVFDVATDLDTTLLDVEVGSILVKAEKLKGASKFEVKTPTSIVGIRGTTFEVSVGS